MFNFFKKKRPADSTKTEEKSGNSRKRELLRDKNREVDSSAQLAARIPMQVEQKDVEPESSVLKIFCPICAGENFSKRGIRKNKQRVVQLYWCNDCQKTFTPGATRGKHYPMSLILDAMSLYNIGYSLEEAVKRSKAQPSKLSASSLRQWLGQYKSLLAYTRMRPYALKMYRPQEIIVSATLAHRQLYRFRHHRAKTRLIIEEDIKHGRFENMQEFLELVPVECPHEYFQKGLRASEAPIFFSKTQMIVRDKQNYATKLTKFVLDSVKENKDRHDALQRFFLANDSVTVATEVPIYIRREDLLHMQKQLDFKLYKPVSSKGKKALAKELSERQIQARTDRRKKGVKIEELEPYKEEELPTLITGHIDFLQIRNGSIHILDYKPKADKEHPIEQLTLYALALSRLTGIRVYHFKCAWFDENHYFEFFPLHAVYKRKRSKKQKILTKEGTYQLNTDTKKVKTINKVAQGWNNA